MAGCARKGKGSRVFIKDTEDPSEKIIQLLADSLSPAITRVKLDFDRDVVESILPNPESMPYVLKNEIVNFYIRFKGQLKDSARFSFSYEDSLNRKEFRSDILVRAEDENFALVDKMGHFKRIKLLEEVHSSKGRLNEFMYFAKEVDCREEAIRESVASQVLSEFTAFVGV